MASFQAKIRGKMLRKRENKNYRSVYTRHVIENSKKIQKIIKYHYGCNPSQNRFEKDQKDRKKKLLFHFVPTRRVIENSKKIAKKFKILKNTIKASFYAIIGWKRPRKRETKNYRSVRFLPYA